MTKYCNYRPKQFGEFWYVIAGTQGDFEGELKIAKIPHWLRHQKSVAIAISEALNRDRKLQLVDLI